MSGLVPSSAAPGSSADGTPGAPTRSSRRTTCDGSGTSWPSTGVIVSSVGATKNVTTNVTSGARTAATQPNIGAGLNVFMRGTHYSAHTFRVHPRRVAGVQNLLGSEARGAGAVTEWQGSHTDGQKHRKFNMSTGGQLPANLDFLFCSRLYFEHTINACA